MVYADNDLEIVLSHQNVRLNRLELAAWINITPALINTVVNLTELKHVTLFCKQTQTARLFLELCKIESIEIAFTEIQQPFTVNQSVKCLKILSNLDSLTIDSNILTSMHIPYCKLNLQSSSLLHLVM